MESWRRQNLIDVTLDITTSVRYEEFRLIIGESSVRPYNQMCFKTEIQEQAVILEDFRSGVVFI